MIPCVVILRLHCNGSVVNSSPAGVTCQLELAQFSMLAWLGRKVAQAVALAAIQQSCKAQTKQICGARSLGILSKSEQG
jgi:hypothetical protein